MDIRKFSGKLILGVLFCLVLALLPGMDMTAQAVSFDVGEIKVQESWRNDQTVLTTKNNYPGFAASTKEIAKTWKAPSTGKYVLIYNVYPYQGYYACDGVKFENGVYTEPYGNISRKDRFYETRFEWNYNGIYYMKAISYSVTMTGGTNAVASGGSTSQTGVTGDMKTVTYTANNGYQFPATSDYYKTTNGIEVKRTSNTVITVSGKPTDDTNITIPNAAPIPYDLWVGGVEVTGVKLSGEGWSFDPGTNTLSLNGFSYTGDGSKGNNQDSMAPRGAIFYSGSTPFTISLTGENTAACTSYTKNAGIYVSSSASLTITGTGTLNATGQSGSNIDTYGIFGSNIMITGGTVHVTGGNTSDRQSAGIFGLVVSITGGTVNATGGNTTNTWSAGIRSASSVTIGTGATVKAVGGKGVYSFGIHAGKNPVTIESDVASVICEGTDGTSETLGINGTVKNAVAGMGWTTEQTIKTIDINSGGSSLNYKKVQFPRENKVTIPEFEHGSISGSGFYKADTTVTLTVTPEIGYQLKAGSLTYTVDGSEDKVTISGPDSEGKYSFTVPDADVTVNAEFEKVNYTITLPEIGDAGTITAKIGNVQASTAQYGDEVTLTVTPAQGWLIVHSTVFVSGSTIEAGPAADTSEVFTYTFTMPAENVNAYAWLMKPPAAIDALVYNGKEQSLITAGEKTTEHDMEYAIGDASTAPDDTAAWSTTIPQGKDAGTYYVWYRLTNDFVFQPVAVTITQKEITVSVADAADVTYDGNEHTGNTVYTFTGVLTDPAHTATITYTPAKGKLASSTAYEGSFSDDLMIKDAENTDVTANYNLKTKTPGKLKITDRAEKYAITVEANSNTGNIYDGTEKLAAGLKETTFTVEGNTYTVSGLTTSDPASTNVIDTKNEISGTAVVKDADNNDVTNQFTVTKTDGSLVISQREVTVSVENAADVTYDGSEHSGNTAYTFTNILSNLSHTATITYTPATGTTVGTYTGSYGEDFQVMAGNDDVTGNYTLTTKTAGSMNIIRRSVTVSVENAADVTYDGNENSSDKQPVFNNVADGQNASITYTPATGTTVGSYTGSYGEDFQVMAGTEDVTANYTLTTKTAGSMNIIQRSVTVSVENAADVTYDGNEHSSDKQPVFNNVADRQIASITYTPAKGTTVGSYTGSYGEDFQVMSGTEDVTANYTLTKKTPGNLNIIDRTEKFEITVKANSSENTYDGQPHSAEGFETLEFTVGGNAYTVSGLSTSDPSSTNVTSQSLVNVISGTAVVKDSAENDVTSQFNVTTENGSLLVNPRTVTVSVDDAAAVTYDGQEHTSDKQPVFVNVVDGQTASITYTPAKGTTVGTYTGSYGEDFKVMVGDEDVTSNYSLADTDKTPGNLVINPREVTVSVENAADVTYDGSEHSGNTAYTFNNILSNLSHTATITYTPAKGTTVGTYTGSYGEDFKVMAGDEEVTANYSLTDKTPGSLTIRDRSEKYQITVVSKGIPEPITYDGQDHMMEGFETLSFEVGGNTYTVSGLTASVSEKDAGTYKNVISGTAVVMDANDNDVTDQFTISLEEGTMEIIVREITVSTPDKSVGYTGEEQSGETEYTFVNLVDGHTAVISYTPAKGTQAGTYEGAFGDDLAVTDAAGIDVTMNYDLTEKTAGKLEIVNVPVTVKVIPGANMTKTADSGAEEQTVNKGSAIKAVVYTAAAGYYFPEDYSMDAVNGISVSRDSDSDKQITVSGLPTKDTDIKLKDAEKEPEVEAPVIDPKEGTYQEPQTVTISCATEGAVIYYTTDGSDPSVNSTKYEGPFTIDKTTTIKAIAVLDGKYFSVIVTEILTIELPPETWEINVDIHNFSNTGAKGVPGDVPRTEITLTIQIIEKESGEVVSTATGVKFDVMGGPNTAKISLENVEFDHKVEDLSEAKYKAVVRVSPSKVSGVAPMNQVYTLTNEAWPGGRELITIYLKWDDGKRSEPERIKVYALPEDEVGAYTILKDGTKEYLIFHTYDICMQWLGSDELCRGYERCFHKESPYENPFVTATGVIGEIVN